MLSLLQAKEKKEAERKEREERKQKGLSMKQQRETERAERAAAKEKARAERKAAQEAEIEKAKAEGREPKEIQIETPRNMTMRGGDSPTKTSALRGNGGEEFWRPAPEIGMGIVIDAEILDEVKRRGGRTALHARLP